MKLLTPVKYRDASVSKDFKPLYPVLSLLSYTRKAPPVKPGMDVVNSQRNALEAFIKKHTRKLTTRYAS